MYGAKWRVRTLLAAAIDEVDDDEEVRVCVFAIPMRRRVDGVVFGRENNEVRDCVVEVM